MRKFGFTTAVAMLVVLVAAPIAQACGFLVAANGAVRLGRTSTFVAWEDGIEHYITNFTFEGEVDSFGSLIPLPSEPTDVSRAGDWTLQRLQIEVQREEAFLLRGLDVELSASEVEVILQQ